MINLNPQDRFIKTGILRSSYISYEESLNPTGPRYISFESEDLELGIVSGWVPEVAKAVSSILCRSLEDAKDTNGGYLPPLVVQRVQSEIISPHGVSHLWGSTGHRFVLSRSAGPDMREIVASLLVGRSKDTIFFFTGRYNNLRHSTIHETVDLNQPAVNNPEQKWFDQFNFPPLKNFKPNLYHQVANFVVDKNHRGIKLSRFLIDNIVKYYSRNHIDLHNSGIHHSQHLLCGKGLWQIGDPPWLPKMKSLGFYLRGGAESFFIEHDWAPLPSIYKDGQVVSNIDYNQSFELFQIYNELKLNPKSQEHLLDRIPEVMALSKNPKAKLQYFQAMFDFT